MGPSATPTKVCPHCHVSSQTVSTVCPSCGKKYQLRKVWPWVVGGIAVVLIIPIAFIAAVANKVEENQRVHGITRAQYESVATGGSEAEVIREVRKDPQTSRSRHDTVFGRDVTTRCIFYNDKDGNPGDYFAFCFLNDRLVTKTDNDSP